MNFKKNISFLILPSLLIFLTGCAGSFPKKSGSFKHDTPLIKTDIKKIGQKEVDKNKSANTVSKERKSKSKNDS